MSLFRKPKKIQRRVFCADDQEEGDPEPPPPPKISPNLKEKDVKPKKVSKSGLVLSFADEEEDGEVFQVKKSSQSKRLAKKREKEKRKFNDDENYKDSNEVEEINTIKLEEPKEKTKKKVTLEGLILSGREALAADGAGDVSDESQEEEDDEDNRGFHRYRAENVRAALAVAPGNIPDAALIHAARKTRQQARELGDFIPVKPETKPGSRLVRDDGSGDEDDGDGRIQVRGLELPSDKPKRGTEAHCEVEMDSGGEEWEEQQIKKAVPAIGDITGDISGLELNPFSRSLPAPQLTPAPAHLRPLLPPRAPSAAAPATPLELCEALRERVRELQQARQQSAEQREQLQTRLLVAARVRESRLARTGSLARAYRRAQAVRGFLTDLVECLDEKMPELEALEARALALYLRRCDFVAERRRADVRDQAEDVMAMFGRGGAKGPDSEEKLRRTVEREGRRRARRLRREQSAQPLAHRDGDSSDDDLPPAQTHLFHSEREAVRAAGEALFADALPAWRSAQGVAGRLARWRRAAPSAYRAAHLPAFLPRLLAPYVRHALLLWNPLHDDCNQDLQHMDWYKCLMTYGATGARQASDSESTDGEDVEEPTAATEDAVREDADLMLVPTIVAKVVVPKVTELVEAAWDPWSVRASVRLRALALRLAGAAGRGRELQALGRAAHARLLAAAQADVFVPMLGPGGGPAALLFWRRCVGGGARLLRAAVALCPPPEPLCAATPAMYIIESLCVGCGAARPELAAEACAVLAEALPRPPSPLRLSALRRLRALARHARARLHGDDPHHLKALEQVRNVISEADQELGAD